MKKLNCFLVLFSAFSHLLFCQQKKDMTFGEIRKNYERMTIDNGEAMPYVRSYINKAKNEGNHLGLIQGYRDGRQFDLEHKLQYADSALTVSLKYGTRDDIAKDYLSKGIIYYFYQKKYKLALDQYLKAYQYLKGSKDQYLKYKVIYHLGVIKEHLGYYDESLEHFQDCATFYGAALDKKLHDHEKFNYKKAFLNSLHQLTVSHRYLKNFSKSDSLSRLGYQLSSGDEEFQLEQGYFLKCMGISKFHKKDYDRAEKDLETALPLMLKRNDFAWASVIYYYLGRIAETRNNQIQAFRYYSKIDTIFTEHQIILPEVYSSYHYLIKYYKASDVNKELYYTNQLLKADSLICKEYPYLSSKLHRDYDRNNLIEEKENMEKAGERKIRMAKFFILSGTLVLSFFIVRYFKDRNVKKQYDFLQKKITESQYVDGEIAEQNITDESVRKTSLTPEMTLEIRNKLAKFEKELLFRKKGLTQKSIANLLHTNSHYLSVYINENKNMNFNRYMAELRINYITRMLNTDNKYLHYTIEALAEECGIAARQNFSKLFFQINGIRPADYIRRRKQELGLD